jgi:LysM repeat protein
MPTFAAPTRRFALVALLCAASLAGCDESRITGPVAETEDANFQDGKRLAGEGKEREALNAFLKVILTRREAPEAHWEAGNLCLSLKPSEPLEAIFHFKQYLRLRPDAVQAGVVQQRIRTAEKDFLKTLPFRPLEGNSSDRVAELMEQIKLVRAENDDLKRRQTSLLTAAARPAPVATNTVVADVDEPVASTPTNNPPVNPPAGNKPVTATSRRTHTIAKGENLTIISRKYYGTPNRWKDILNANSRVMKNERDLKVGRVLEIPE